MPRPRWVVLDVAFHPKRATIRRGRERRPLTGTHVEGVDRTSATCGQELIPRPLVFYNSPVVGASWGRRQVEVAVERWAVIGLRLMTESLRFRRGTWHQLASPTS